MNKLTKVIDLTAQFLFEVSKGKLLPAPPAPVVVTERKVATGETLQLVRHASLAGGYYRIFLKPEAAGTRPWFGPRSSREGAAASFDRMAARLT